MNIEVPKVIADKLREESRKKEVSEGELVLEALSEFLRFDPETNAEAYLSLSQKYLREGKELLEKGDCAQASEEFWGAASLAVKAKAMKRGLKLRSHGELHKFVSRLSSEVKEPEILTIWLSSASLHQNFYENWLPEEAVRNGAESVKRFVEKLRDIKP